MCRNDEFDDEFNWLFTKIFRAFYLLCRKQPNLSQNFCYSHSLNFHLSGSTKSVSKQPTQLIVQLNSSLRHIIVTKTFFFSITTNFIDLPLHINTYINNKIWNRVLFEHNNDLQVVIIQSICGILLRIGTLSEFLHFDFCSYWGYRFCGVLGSSLRKPGGF